ncbi:hypothetical protein [Shewanella sp. SR44-3]|uniref:hypothetical protein n=1 Tax=Shewanella sp. SR44-3 TaxID=2760936 RepID=UPI0015F7A5C3|nr:hypothetical protein [Shewanella sp. SR44-3]MBB1270814.1 hypothetical protein [Shewanella sp. SR44-3]
MERDYLILAHQYYDSSIRHLESEDDLRLSYAALDMRLAIEATIYKKCEMLGQFKEELPKNVWQPKPLLLRIEQLHPELNTKMKIAVAIAESDAPPSNESEWIQFPIDIKILGKDYGTLGGYVHMTTPHDLESVSYDKIRKKLAEIIERWAILVKSWHFTVTPRLVTNNACKSCGTRLLYSEDFIIQRKTIRCLSQDCGAEYKINQKLELEYLSAFEIPCMHCSNVMDVHKSQIGKYIDQVVIGKQPSLILECPVCAGKTKGFVGISYESKPHGKI